MKCSPFHNQRMGATRWFASQNLNRFDLLNGFILAILGVEVRGRVVVVKHANNNAKERTDAWHTLSVLLPTMIPMHEQSRITKPQIQSAG